MQLCGVVDSQSMTSIGFLIGLLYVAGGGRSPHDTETDVHEVLASALRSSQQRKAENFLYG